MRQKLIFAAALTGIVFFWCVVLPKIALNPPMKRQLKFLDDRGIDPSAMFYTELDAMQPILHRLEKR